MAAGTSLLNKVKFQQSLVSFSLDTKIIQKSCFLVWPVIFGSCILPHPVLWSDIWTLGDWFLTSHSVHLIFIYKVLNQSFSHQESFRGLKVIIDTFLKGRLSLEFNVEFFLFFFYCFKFDSMSQNSLAKQANMCFSISMDVHLQPVRYQKGMDVLF